MTWQLLVVVLAAAALARLAWIDAQARAARRTLVGKGILAPPVHPNCRCVIGTGRVREVYLRGGILDGEEAEYDADRPPPRLSLWRGGDERMEIYFRADVAGWPDDDVTGEGKPIYYAENLVKEDPWTESSDIW